RRRHTRCYRDWSSDVCSSDLLQTWALRWLDPNEGAAADSDGLGAYIHSVTAPEHDATATTFAVDFGSAPVRGVLELLTVLRDSEIGRASCRGREVSGGVAVCM